MLHLLYPDRTTLREDETLVRSCLDEFANLFFAYTSSQRLLTFKYQSPDKGSGAVMTFQHEHAMDDESPELESSELVQMDFIQEVQGVVMSYSNGSMFLFKVDSKEVEEVGVLPDGILTGSWAPNQEYLAIASKSGKLLLFTPEFDVMHEA